MDQHALHRELQSNLKAIRRFAYSLSGTMADADDLLQATVLRILERGVPADVVLTRWAFRVCRNLWIDQLRMQGTRAIWAREQEDVGERLLDGERVAESSVTFGEVQQAMQALPEDQRVLLALVAVEGLSYREAADVLDIPMGTVMSRMSRARAAMAARFDQGTAAGTD